MVVIKSKRIDASRERVPKQSIARISDYSAHPARFVNNVRRGLYAATLIRIH